EASIMFEELMGNVHKEVLEHFFLTQPVMQAQEPEQQVVAMQARQATLEESIPEASGDPEAEEVINGTIDQAGSVQPVRREAKVGRNDPCPCGSGKKYKKCCGATADTV